MCYFQFSTCNKFILQDELEDKAETPGETPDPRAVGLGGQRPLGLEVAVLPDTPPALPVLPPPIAKKRMCVTPPPVPPRLDAEVGVFYIFATIILEFLTHQVHASNLQSAAALKEFDFLEEPEMTRPGSLSTEPPANLKSYEHLVPPSPQPVIDFPDDEVFNLVVSTDFTNVQQFFCRPCGLLLCLQNILTLVFQIEYDSNKFSQCQAKVTKLLVKKLRLP